MPININTASAQELTQLPRIGVDKARKIVYYRVIRKGFRDWADFAGTPGITEADVEAIQTRAWIGPAAMQVSIGTRRRRSTRGPAVVRRPKQST